MSDAVPPPRRRSLLAAAPLIAFLALAGLLFVRLFTGDASRLPSALIGQSAPALNLPGLDGAPGLADADLRQGHVTVVNVFAPWCVPCRTEHEFLLALAHGRAGIDWGVYGVPETFVVRGDGVIAFKQIGPIDAVALESVVKPAILKAAN